MIHPVPQDTRLNKLQQRFEYAKCINCYVSQAKRLPLVGNISQQWKMCLQPFRAFPHATQFPLRNMRSLFSSKHLSIYNITGIRFNFTRRTNIANESSLSMIMNVCVRFNSVTRILTQSSSNYYSAWKYYIFQRILSLCIIYSLSIVFTLINIDW